MKPKKFSKKLGLNKITIANLNQGEMQRIFGGDDSVSIIPYVCPPPTLTEPASKDTKCWSDCVCPPQTDTCFTFCQQYSCDGSTCTCF
jgi:natural product precursor